MNGPNCIEAHECRGDFWIMMREAVIQAGGCPSIVERYADKPLKDVVEILAQNGIRMVYIPSARIDKIKVASKH
jgi:hypothetical protein